MKIKLLLVPLLLIASISSAGTLNVGGAKMDGHSNKKGECINPGYSIDIGYDWTLVQYTFLKYLGVSLDGGGLATYSNYETANREYVGGKETNQQRKSSMTIAGVLKPTVHLWKLYYYRMIGAGPDYSQPDGLDYGWLEGKGLGFNISSNVSIEVSKREFYRHDTGNSKHSAITLKFRF
jgi:hypothetical protein